MKTKKFLSLVLALFMILSMATTFGISATATTYDDNSHYTVDFSYNGITQKLNGNIKDYDFGLLLSGFGITEEIEAIQVYNEEKTTVYDQNRVTNANNELLFEIAEQNGRWIFNSYRSFTDTFYAVVSTATDSYTIVVTDPKGDPHVKVGETATTVFCGTYSSDEVDGNYYYFTSAESDKLEIVNVEQSGDDIIVTVKGLAEATDVEVDYKVYDAASSTWVDNHSNNYWTVDPSDNTAYLDIETDETYRNCKSVEQTYKLTAIDGTYTHVTKVKLEWAVTDITATRKDAKVWDPDQLKWVDDNSNDAISAENGGAEFKLTNLSSIKVNATVIFEAEEGFNPRVSFDATTGTNGKITIDSVVGANHTVTSTTAPTATITVTVKPGDNDFKTKSATDGAKYGTYTVTLSGRVKITFQSISDNGSTIYYNGTWYEDGEQFVLPVVLGSQISCETDTANDRVVLTVDGKTVYFNQVNPTLSVNGVSVSISDLNGYAVEDDCTISANMQCILEGTMILLADGTEKAIEDITLEDELMAFNFFDGKTEGQVPMYILKHENVLSEAITLTFSDGNTLRMCDSQDFFDMDAKDYFNINVWNFKDAIGMNVMRIKDGAVDTVQIVDAVKTVETCTSYELYTAYTANFVANHILTLEPDTIIPGTYQINDDLKIDMIQYNADVAEYGLYTYSDFANYMSEGSFEKSMITDRKIAVGKGLITEEELFSAFDEWIPTIKESLC